MRSSALKFFASVTALVVTSTHAFADHLDGDVNVIPEDQVLQVVSSEGRAYLRKSRNAVLTQGEGIARMACEAEGKDFVEYIPSELSNDDRTVATTFGTYRAVTFRKDGNRVISEENIYDLHQAYTYSKAQSFTAFEKGCLAGAGICTIVGAIAVVMCYGGDGGPDYTAMAGFGGGGGGLAVLGVAACGVSRIRTVLTQGKDFEITEAQATEIVNQGGDVNRKLLNVRAENGSLYPLFAFPLLAKQVWCRDREGQPPGYVAPSVLVHIN